MSQLFSVQIKKSKVGNISLTGKKSVNHAITFSSAFYLYYFIEGKLPNSDLEEYRGNIIVEKTVIRATQDVWNICYNKVKSECAELCEVINQGLIEIELNLADLEQLQPELISKYTNNISLNKKVIWTKLLEIYNLVWLTRWYCQDNLGFDPIINKNKMRLKSKVS